MCALSPYPQATIRINFRQLRLLYIQFQLFNVSH